MSLDLVQFYLANVEFLHKGKVVGALEQKYWLLDASESSRFDLPFAASSADIDAIRFQIGVDSLTNVSGAMGGDLDPSLGMYWAWQSGYINIKMEGTATTCPTRNHSFQYHLGGYQSPNYAMQSVQLSLKNTDAPKINIHLDAFFDKTDLTQTHTVMSPSSKAVELAQQFAALFRINL